MVMNLLLADQQDIAKAGIRHYVSKLSEEVTLIEVNDKKELVEELQKNPDSMVILDYTNMDFQTAEDILIVEDRFPNSQWMLFSLELSEVFLRQVILSNTRTSVIMKDCKAEEIEFALHSMFHHERYLCHLVSNMLLNVSLNKQKETSNDPLTQTEKQILKEIAQGKTTKEIAANKNLSFHTVNTHRKNIFRKLEVNNVHEAIKYAMKAGIVDVAEYYI